MGFLNAWAMRALVVVLAALGAFGGGWWAGARAQRHADAAERLAQAQAAAEALRRETARADAAVARFVKEQREQEGRYAEMDAKYRALKRSAPLVVGAVACNDAGSVGAHAGATGDAAGGVPDGASTRAAVAPGLGAGAGGLELSLAAVRMWNGALAGRDLPAGACGAADDAAGAGAACAEGSGIGLDDAWDNHALNARRCAQDRQQLRALIGLLRAQGRAGDGAERAAGTTTTPQGE